jgi:hypothetical protein
VGIPVLAELAPANAGGNGAVSLRPKQRPQQPGGLIGFVWRTTLLKISRAGKQQARPWVCLCGRGRVKEEKRSLRRLTALVVTSHGKIAYAPAGMI